MNMTKDALAIWIISTIMLSTFVASSVASAPISQALTTEAEQYEGHYYVKYDFAVVGDAPLIVLMESPDFDSYIVLLQPNGKALANDDHGDLGTIRSGSSTDAGIRVDEPESGRWSLLATSLSPGATGAFTIVLEGVSDRRIAEANIEDVTNAFAARGVFSEEEARERRMTELVEQLSLATFRANLHSKLLSELHEAEKVESGSQTRLAELEDEVRNLEGAADDLRLLPESSKRILEPLLQQRLADAAKAKEATTATLIEATAYLAGCRQALQELDELHAVAEDLDPLREGLMREGNIDELQKLRESIPEAESRFQWLAETIARKLLDSGFVDEDEEVLVGEAFGHSGISLDSLVLPEALSREFDPSVWLPQLLPWPPPDASARLVLRGGLLRYPNGESPATLGELADILQAALRDAGYDGGGYLGVPTGFAIVTRLEQTNELGQPLDGERRWITSIVGMRGFSLAEYIRVLLTAPAGYFRVLAFVVASEPFSSSGSRDRLAAVQAWSTTSVGSLPDELREQKLHDGYEVTVLVYEFLKRRESDRPKTTVPGHLTARDHLVRAGLDGLVGEG